MYTSSERIRTSVGHFTSKSLYDAPTLGALRKLCTDKTTVLYAQQKLTGIVLEGWVLILLRPTHVLVMSVLLSSYLYDICSYSTVRAAVISVLHSQRDGGCVSG